MSSIFTLQNEWSRGVKPSLVNSVKYDPSKLLFVAGTITELDDSLAEMGEQTPGLFFGR